MNSQLPKSTSRGFTLIEMLVVLLIVGILASVTLSGIRGFSESKNQLSTTFQIMADLHNARQRALSSGSPVYVLFYPSQYYIDNWIGSRANRAVLANYFRTNKTAGSMRPMASYAFYSTESIGDQPGRSSAKYLSEWKQLPRGSQFGHTSEQENQFSFPYWTNWIAVSGVENNSPPTNRPTLLLPYICFNGRGQLVVGTNDPLRPLTKPVKLYSGLIRPGSKTNGVIINHMTGRARMLKLGDN